MRFVVFVCAPSMVQLAVTVDKFKNKEEFFTELSQLMEQEFSAEFATFDSACDCMNKAIYTALCDITEILEKQKTTAAQ